MNTYEVKYEARILAKGIFGIKEISCIKGMEFYSCQNVFSARKMFLEEVEKNKPKSEDYAVIFSIKSIKEI